MPLYTNQTDPDQYITLVDEVGTNTYVGIGLVSVTPDSIGWKIKRISEIGAQITISWADGSTEFDKIWADRETYDYSV
jgi:hypothetical protein